MRPVLFTSSIIVLVFALQAGSAFADEPFKLDFEKFTLSNGLDVILHEDHSLPMVTVNILYHVGSKNESPGRTGFAHLFEHMMFQGTPNYQGDYIVPIQAIGGIVNGGTFEDRTTYFEDVPGNYVELALAMESDRMANLLDGLDQENLSMQQDIVKNERRENFENSPYGTVADVMPKLMFPPGHPYSWPVIGSMADLTAATLDDVKDFFRQFYTPNNASLCVAGDFDPAQARELVRKYFGAIPPGPPVSRLTSWVPSLDGVRRAVIEDDVELPMLWMLWHSPAAFTPGDAEGDIIANILSTGKTSRLYSSLVYERQIAQDVIAFQESKELSGLLWIMVFAIPGHTLDEIEAAVDEELRRLIAEGITDQELAQAKTNWEAQYVRSLQTIGGFSGRANTLNMYNVTLESPDKLAWDMARYTRATVDDVMAFVHTYLDLDRRGIIRVVPRGTPIAETAVDWSVRPVEGPPPTFTPPEIQTATLANGLKILLVEDHRLPLIDFRLVVKRGWAADPPGKFGVASLTSDMLNEGTRNLTALEISDSAKSLGCQVTSNSDFQSMSIGSNVLKKNFGAALELVADIVRNPIFPEADLERLRKQYLATIQEETKQPFTAAFKTLNYILYGENHPYSQSFTGAGSAECLTGITRDDLVSLYTAISRPNISAVVINGDITLAEVRRQIERAFGDWARGPVPDPMIPPPQKTSVAGVYIVDRPGAEQSMIMAGHVCMSRQDPNFAAFNALNRPLGANFSSRINMNLREDKGFTYGARSFLQARGLPGPFYAYAPVQTEFTKEALFELMKELKDILGSRPLTADELARSKGGLIKNFPQGFQNLGAISDQLATLFVYDLPLDDWATYAERISGITAGQVADVAKRYIHPDDMAIIIVGDRSKIESGLKDLNLGKVVQFDMSGKTDG